MQIQSNCINNNNTFKASLINDKKGYFRELWRQSALTDDLKLEIDRFYNSNKGHKLEIIDVKQSSKSCRKYTFFNHKNGHEKTIEIYSYFTEHDFGALLKNLLTKLMNVKELFEEGTASARMYQKLTGQKVDVDAII